MTAKVLTRKGSARSKAAEFDDEELVESPPPSTAKSKGAKPTSAKGWKAQDEADSEDEIEAIRLPLEDNERYVDDIVGDMRKTMLANETEIYYGATRIVAIAKHPDSDDFMIVGNRSGAPGRIMEHVSGKDKVRLDERDDGVMPFPTYWATRSTPKGSLQYRLEVAPFDPDEPNQTIVIDFSDGVQGVLPEFSGLDGEQVHRYTEALVYADRMIAWFVRLHA